MIIIFSEIECKYCINKLLQKPPAILQYSSQISGKLYDFFHTNIKYTRDLIANVLKVQKFIFNFLQCINLGNVKYWLFLL